jgi:hypothetical protein
MYDQIPRYEKNKYFVDRRPHEDLQSISITLVV